MLPMVLAAALLATAADPTAALPAAPPSPPGASPGAKIFSYADLKAMDAKASSRTPSLKRAESASGGETTLANAPRRGAHPRVRHAAEDAASSPATRPASPKLRPAFAMKETAKFTR